MNIGTKQLLRFGGGVLGLIGIIFLMLRLRQYGHSIERSHIGFSSWLIFFGLAAVYGCSNCLLSNAWKSLLEFRRVYVSTFWAFKAYGMSQLAKYIPGNVFHVASRQAIGMGADIPARPLAESAFYELALLAIAGASFTPLVLSALWPGFPIWLAASLFALLLPFFFVVVRKVLDDTGGRAFAAHLIFLSISGAIFLLVMLTISDVDQPSVSILLMSGYIIAWLLGFATPGAPAGLGVRESVLLILVGQHVDEASLLLAIVLTRAITVAGDLIFYIAATSVARERHKS
ncbi:hypothetical protein ACXYTJ_13715 [Gilvimarinus sp. F26214L]|uniref:hypothetical protein n=1 Tax=Gilvimarinus sp. DZF01 TaxID=3461371 RepID=UPI004045C2F8